MIQQLNRSFCFCFYFFFQAEDGIRDLVRSRGLGDVYKRQCQTCQVSEDLTGLENKNALARSRTRAQRSRGTTLLPTHRLRRRSEGCNGRTRRRLLGFSVGTPGRLRPLRSGDGSQPRPSLSVGRWGGLLLPLMVFQGSIVERG